MNTNKLTIINADLLASMRATKAQTHALVLALQDFTDAPGNDAQKSKRKSACARIGKDVLKRKNALRAKTPSELRQYVESIRQKSQALAQQLPNSTWLLEHCTRELVRVTLSQTIDLCSVFVAEYEEARTDAERKALADKKLDPQANAINAKPLAQTIGSK